MEMSKPVSVNLRKISATNLKSSMCRSGNKEASDCSIIWRRSSLSWGTISRLHHPSRKWIQRNQIRLKRRRNNRNNNRKPKKSNLLQQSSRNKQSRKDFSVDCWISCQEWAMMKMRSPPIRRNDPAKVPEIHSTEACHSFCRHHAWIYHTTLLCLVLLAADNIQAVTITDDQGAT